MKKCIIFSYGPVPTPEQNKVEGGGLRCWGLAKGLRESDSELEITVAYHESYRKSNHTEVFESINIQTWNNDTIEALMVGKDAVLVSYSMGDLSVIVTEKIKANQQLILDCYVPAYIEISARESNDLKGEYDAFHNEVNRWALVLRRGDIYLCANSNQKRYYQGVLSALGRINPATYQDDPIKIVPYGIYKEPPIVTERPITRKLEGSKKHYRKVLWFGAVYPWFDLRDLIEAINELNKEIPTKLVIVGAKNPFNGHPDFVKQYENLIEYIENNEEAKNNIILQEWVEFNDRANWYLDSDIVISINKIGEENELAWRTRLVDYIWADLPIITNAGDPLGDELVEAGAARKLNDITAEGLLNSLKSALEDEKGLVELKTNLKNIRTKYLWGNAVKPLYEAIQHTTRPTDFTEFGLIDAIPDGRYSIVSKVLVKSKKIPTYYKRYGLKSTIITAKTFAQRKLNRSITEKRKKAVVFISHQLDTTGAPHVLLDLVKEFTNSNKNVPIVFHSYNPTTPENILKLNKLGITPRIHMSHDTRPKFAKNDVVVMNTVAFSDSVKDAVFAALESGLVKKVLWYIHEDEPSIIFGMSETNRIKKLLKSDKMTMFVLAERTRKAYIKHFGETKNIIDQPYKLTIDKNRHITRSTKDFDVLRFVLPGMVGDGRKGQLPLLYAFIEFKKRYYDVHPDKYRDFNLMYVGLGNDFLSRQIIKHSSKGLGDKFEYYKAMSHEKCLDEIANSNITLCYSMRESLPLFVYEGMTAGHVLLRNDCSGLEEQLIDGKNGYLLDSTDFEQVIQVIEKIANKTTTSNKMLVGMSNESRKIAKEAESTSYKMIDNKILEAFTK